MILAESKESKPLDVSIQQWICFRRISGGFNKGQQTQLANVLMPLVIDKKTGKIEVRGKSELNAYSEKIRALASMELIDIPMKLKLGNALIERIERQDPISADFWSLGRLGARHLIYGSQANVLPKETTEQWIARLLKLTDLNNKHMLQSVEQLARKTDHREINVSQETINAILKCYKTNPAIEQITDLLTKASNLTETEQEEMYGDKLPAGLSL